jgi:hypothetical protein
MLDNVEKMSGMIEQGKGKRIWELRKGLGLRKDY